MLENLYKSMSAILGFLVIIILISTFTNEKSAQNMALFILLGMLLLNVNAIVDFLSKLNGESTESEG